MTTQNPWLQFLESDDPGRKAAYFSYGDQWGGSPRSRRQGNFFQNSFTELYHQYLGTLGKQVRAGLEPTGAWNDYLGGFNFNDYYRQQTTSEQRNPQAGGFVPQARWDVLRR